MSVTAKTLGIVLIGLVGLLLYVAFYMGGAFAPVIGPGLAYTAIYLGLALTVVLMLALVAVTATAD